MLFLGSWRKVDLEPIQEDKFMSNKVFHHGKDGYHIDRSKTYGDEKVLNSMTAEIMSQEGVSHREGMRKAIGILDYHDQKSEGKGVGKGTHDRLKQQAREAMALKEGVVS
jgi:hypothetical protein